jgi:1-carboxybiuret hydrolase subunit AtzG-like protein
MTRRPRAAKARRVRPRKVRPAVKRARRSRREPLDEFIAASARALDLKIDEPWKPAVRSHLDVTLRHANRVASFVLPDDAEPAPVFKA